MSLFAFFWPKCYIIYKWKFTHFHCLVITNSSCSTSVFHISFKTVCLHSGYFQRQHTKFKKSDCVAEMECSLSCMKVLKIVEIIHVLFAFFYSFIFLFSNTQTHSFTQEQTFSLSAKSIIKNKSKMRRQNSTRRKSNLFAFFLYRWPYIVEFQLDS